MPSRWKRLWRHFWLDEGDTRRAIPPALVELMARPGTVDVPLDDVVPGEPESAHSEVHA